MSFQAVFMYIHICVRYLINNVAGEFIAKYAYDGING